MKRGEKLYSQIQSCVMLGLSGELIRVEVDISNGIPTFTIVGLPNAAVREAKERVRSAMMNAGIEFPLKRVTVNLYPADLPKEGSHLDLPIAVGIMAAMEGLDGLEFEDMAFLGEVSLNGKVNGIPGALAIGMELKERGITKLMLPKENLEEVSILSEMLFYPVERLEQVKTFLFEKKGIDPILGETERRSKTEKRYEDYADVRGQREALRAAVISAAGFHSLLLSGPPGSGKSLIMKRLPGILPDMDKKEQLEVTKIYSAAGLYDYREGLMKHRPFRSPHHSISTVAMVGGGRIPRPGEITLAHDGVLFLDEIAEFGKDRLEALRQPLEDEIVSISRVNGTVTFPAKFLLAGACNPCPCGYYGTGSKQCTCTSRQIQRYRSRLSGPLLDRFDLFVSVGPIKEFDNLIEERRDPDWTTEKMRRQVEGAREIQKERYDGLEVQYNSRLTPELIERFCILSPEGARFMEEVFRSLNLSARAAHKVMKTARTIADLEDSEKIEASHIAEAANYRRREND